MGFNNTSVSSQELSLKIVNLEGLAESKLKSKSKLNPRNIYWISTVLGTYGKKKIKKKYPFVGRPWACCGAETWTQTIQALRSELESSEKILRWLRNEVSPKFVWGIRESSWKSCHLIKAMKNNTIGGFFWWWFGKKQRGNGRRWKMH